MTTFKTIVNRYATICRRCHEAVNVGEKVRWAKGRGVYHLANMCEGAGGEIPIGANFFNTGRCEDAPCCGCCGVNIYGENQEY